MFRILGTISPLLFFVPSAFGATTYDLHDMLSKQQIHQAGDRYRTTVKTTNRASYSPRQERSNLESIERVENEVLEADFVTDIQQVNPNGQPTLKVVHYNQFESSSLNGSRQVVQGVQVQFQQTEGTQDFEYLHLGGPPIPNALKNELEAELEALSQPDRNDAERIQQLLPAESVSVGKTWSIDVIPFIESMDAPITPSTKRSKGQGAIERLDTIDGRDFLLLHFEIRAKLENINDMPCKSSCVLDMQLDLQIPVDGLPGHSMMTNSVRLTGRFGSPQTDDPNMVVLDLVRTDTERTVPVLKAE